MIVGGIPVKTITSKISKLLAAAFTAFILVSCGGGGGGGGGTSTAGGGSVAVALTDKPASLGDIDEILITITGVELFAEDGGKITLYSGSPRGPYDLLKLEHQSQPLAFGPNVPAGSYCKIRLTLSDLELVFNTGQPNFHPKLPGNNKLDLNARQCFYVAPNSTVYLQLDMNANSIHVVQTGNNKQYNFRPVVFIDVIQGNFPAKLVRLENGVIRDINRDAGTLLLCEFSYGENAKGDFNDCMTVLVSRETSAFDNIDDDGINNVSGGAAIPLAELMVPERVGEKPVTVIGRFSNDNHGGSEYPVVDAIVVELGGFLDLNGTVASGASDSRFNMSVDPNQGIQAQGELSVALQPAPSGGNGTKILSPSGEQLSGADIIPPRPVMTDGVLILSDPDYLNSSMVIVDTSANSGNDEASGIIDSVSDQSLRLAADTFPCEAGSGLFNVSFDSSTIVYRSTESGGEFVDTGALAPGQDADISGSCAGTTLDAQTIIIRQ
jgi:hypothetical protein